MPCTSSTSSSFASARTSNNLSVSSPPTSEAPNGSPISKNSPPSLRRTSLVTPIKPRVARSPIPTYGAPVTYPILRSNSPILKSSPIQRVISPIPTSSSPIPTNSSPVHTNSSPILRSSSPISRSSSPILKSMSIKRTGLHTMSAPPLMITVPGESLTSATKHGPFKRGHQYSLLEDGGELEDNGHFPTKRPKTLLTLFTCDRPTDTAVYFTECMLQLSCVSCRTFAAKMEYQRLCTEELELITEIIWDELEEAKTHLTKTDLQIGSLCNNLYDAGVSVIGSKGRPGNPAPKEVD
ncbi:hypothetical protein DFJ58DRAFT_733256 [Suillus subalutaceus]|uniref:uncharacterized protein n=1 Tax=Suillus subalutaceus TaxID=48586 RepID=UPI001B88519A|nr:uncharacterized protein DFJ58DRAFT_733256 [Suillus subalutaceus]KAG1839667.1 hypothetical protein DFJ58DRAFT_733256 [Suillus subalutaceus]